MGEANEVTRLAVSGAGASAKYRVHLKGGGSVLSRRVLLNLPQQPLLTLLHKSSLGDHAREGTLSPERLLHFVKGNPSMKLYLLYDTDAWWRNYLNLTYGTFNNSAAPECQTSGTAVPQFAPVVRACVRASVACV